MNILGLDLGTNSIGWALLSGERRDGYNSLVPTGIIDCGSRIIPMSQDVINAFGRGQVNSKTKERTGFRGTRRLRERHLMRRNRLHQVLNLMGFLPKHYSDNLDRYGHILTDTEPKLPWIQDESGNWQFLFMDSFNEMLGLFAKVHPELVADNRKIPYDWTLYYLRQKALTSQISKFELAWIILNFNQKRGYYQLRGMDVDDENNEEGKKEEFVECKIVSVKNVGDGSYDIVLENGESFNRKSKTPLDSLEGRVKEFIRSEDANGKLSYRMPKDEDWNLQKLKAQRSIDDSGKTVGQYIFDAILNNPEVKIKGGLVRVIERDYYKDELTLILEKQKEFHNELRDSDLCRSCYDLLYLVNKDHVNSMVRKNSADGCAPFTTLFIDDIIFYQRSLKSKKSLIANCQYEYHSYFKDGKEQRDYQKCIAKSHPLFQEFRLWQFVSNVRITCKVETCVKGTCQFQSNEDCTSYFLGTPEQKYALFCELSKLENFDMKTFFKCKCLGLSKDEQKQYRWNYAEENFSQPGNETHAGFLKFFKKCSLDANLLTPEVELGLWHILYSVTTVDELKKALGSFSVKNGFFSDKENDFVKEFVKYKPFKKDYGSYSEKAIKKLLPLMRVGDAWNENDIDCNTKVRIGKFITGEADDAISDSLREKLSKYKSVGDFSGLPLHDACYVVYGRHSEASDVEKWKSPADIDNFLNKFKQHSLRNPIVEQIVLETMRVVRDIWQKYESIDEIHLELGRDLKNPGDKRKAMTAQNLENQKQNYRIKVLLTALASGCDCENVRPYSPSQQEILNIYENTAYEIGAKNSTNEAELKEIAEIREKLGKKDSPQQPNKSEIIRYKAWLEQNYRSPYTGQPVPLSRLFTSDYEIEHVIPQSRYFDDSFANKVICESAVNKLKDNMLAMEFIQKHHGEAVQLGNGKVVNVLGVEDYKQFVNNNYSAPSQRRKRSNLLAEDIPSGFSNRQLNDSRYISRYVIGVLSNIVRTVADDNSIEQEAMSKNLIATNGAVTDELKRVWGINDQWNKIILPRFQRMQTEFGNEQQKYVDTSAGGHQIPVVPLEYQLGFNKKRIDHRHHAMDAIVIACSSRDIVNFISNASASGTDRAKYRYDLQHKLCVINQDGRLTRNVSLPWQSFPTDVLQALQSVVVSFKQNLRVVTLASNKYVRFKDGKKVVEVQNGNKKNWAIRRAMHNDTVWGHINLLVERSNVKLEAVVKDIENQKNGQRRKYIIQDSKLKNKILYLMKLNYDAKKLKRYFTENTTWKDAVDVNKIEVYCFTDDIGEFWCATRAMADLVTLFSKCKSYSEVDEKIDEISDTGIRKILRNHLNRYNNFKDAFSAEGVDKMNDDIVALNGGKPHKPIRKVRRTENSEGKFKVGKTGNKKDKYVENAKDSNLFFVSFTNDKGKKEFVTVPLADAIKCEVSGQSVADFVEQQKHGSKVNFVLSPNDLVCMTDDDGNPDLGNIYKMVSASGKRCFFIPSSVASTIVDKVEFNKLNKIEIDVESKKSIKENCVPIKVDRLGKIISVGNKPYGL